MDNIEKKDDVILEPNLSHGVLIHTILHVVIGLILLIIGIVTNTSSNSKVEYNSYSNAYDLGSMSRSSYTFDSSYNDIYLKFNPSKSYSYKIKLSNSNFTVYYSKGDGYTKTELDYTYDGYYTYTALNVNETTGYFIISNTKNYVSSFTVYTDYDYRTIYQTSNYDDESSALSISKGNYYFSGNGYVYLKLYAQSSSYNIEFSDTTSRTIYYGKVVSENITSYNSTSSSSIYINSVYDYYYIYFYLSSSFTKVTIS